MAGFSCGQIGIFQTATPESFLNKIILVVFLSVCQSIQHQKLAGCKEYRQRIFLVK
jgi:hypothetical protein